MRRGVSVRAYGGADEETVGDTVGEGTGVFSKKAGRKKRKEGAFLKKVHKFLFHLFPFSKIEIFFPQNLRLFETKSLLLRLIKHNFPFIPPHCGVHIAQSRGTFSDHPAQTLFDLLNHRDFALSRPTGTGQRRSLSTSRDSCTTATLPFWFVQKEGGIRNRILFHKKRGTRLLWTTRFGLLPFVSYPAPHAANPRVYGTLCAARGIYRPNRHRSWSDLIQSSPRAYERRDSWGVVSYPNVEKGAIRNRRVRAHVPQRHRVRPRLYHLPWRSGVHRRRRP